MVRLGSLEQTSQAQLDGFKSRALRASAPTHRHLYTTKWCDTKMGGWTYAQILAIGPDEWTARAPAMACHRFKCTSLPLLHQKSEAALCNGWLAVFVMSTATEDGHVVISPLLVLEVAFSLLQVQDSITICLLATGSPGQAGSWGLARSARAEASLPLTSMYVPRMTAALTMAPTLDEPEAALRERTSYAPRLRTAPPALDGLVRLHFHTRGAISNLFLESQSAIASPGDTNVLLRVRAVGLNFRDVLNVLGEYPGDPGPPGGDAAGAVGESPLPVDPMFGLAHAPLASVAIAVGRLVVGKPTALSFEQACTLPVTWSTTHAAVERAALRAGTAFVVQAAAGGVGLKAVEYAQGLQALLTCGAATQACAAA